MENTNLSNMETKSNSSKTLGVVAIVFSSIALAILLFVWGLVVYASITKTFGDALGAAIYFAIGVFAQVAPALIGGICGIVYKKKYATKFAMVVLIYIIVVDVLSIGSLIFAIIK